MDTPSIKFKKSKLLTFTGLTAADIGQKLSLRVLNNVTEKNLVTSESGRQSYIVSLAAVAPDKLPALQEAFADAEEVDIEQTNGLFVTGNIWKNGEETPALPMKGEYVNCIIEQVKNREEENVIRVRTVQVPSAHRGSPLDFATIFEQQQVE